MSKEYGRKAKRRSKKSRKITFNSETGKNIDFKSPEIQKKLEKINKVNKKILEEAEPDPDRMDIHFEK